MRVKLGETFVEKNSFTVTSFVIDGDGVVTELWDDNKSTWLSPRHLAELYQCISSENEERK